jgi:hypothetical protein
MDFCIGTDILDIGSRRAEIKLRQHLPQQQGSYGGDFMSTITNGPTHFDVPNVSNVSSTCNNDVCNGIAKMKQLAIVTHSIIIPYFFYSQNIYMYSRPCIVVITLLQRVGIRI